MNSEHIFKLLNHFLFHYKLPDCSPVGVLLLEAIIHSYYIEGGKVWIVLINLSSISHLAGKMNVLENKSHQ